jgi:hypothetical protein
MCRIGGSMHIRISITVFTLNLSDGYVTVVGLVHKSLPSPFLTPHLRLSLFEQELGVTA